MPSSSAGTVAEAGGDAADNAIGVPVDGSDRRRAQAAAAGGPMPAEDGGRLAVRLTGVCKAYGDGAPAIAGISLAVPQRQFVAIVGASGSGKTTLLKTINRLVEADAGRVEVDGQPVTASPGYALRRRIGYVFQGIGLFPHLTVAENIAITLRLLHWSADRIAARVDELLDLVHLPRDYAARMPAALSGGQQQRVGVARAVAAQPRIMLMDEPFGALDPLTREALGREYRRLHEQIGLTSLMVTHDILEAVLLADRIVVMRAGAIVADGTPHELLAGHFDDGVRAMMDMPRRQAERVRALAAAAGDAGRDAGPGNGPSSAEPSH